MPEISVVASTDKKLVSAVLAQAFIDDPVVRWMAPDPAKHRAFFAAMLTTGHGRENGLDVAMRDGAVVGASVWDPPGFTTRKVDELRGIIGFIRALGQRASYGQDLERLCAEHRPDEPYWYLPLIGATAHGQGIGTTLLHARLDDMRGPVHLEASNEVNVPLYERFGFEVIGEIQLPNDGPKLWPMRRRR
ncbi:N-acetyltransferase [Gordonia sp. OPL2]|uniref:GNAT family N-acetyltransferase n=1 Tax=Gordonia sp. OPL2 TaxID=2486274 RepID=UPI001655361F|nr:GNAT family N-acetyltransferase [Gordonia sp. OPL2]ROZ84487.1 GNAT family N-acetyltransferase [Gordonia sp. OPL2]